jgi:hypothetical protein
MGDIAPILSGDETILWQGRPAVLPFFAGAIASLLVGVGLLAIVAQVVAGQPLPQHPDRLASALFLSPFLLIGILLALWYPVYRILSYLRLSYAITSQRVVFRSGVIEHHVAIVDFDQIVHADMEVDLTDIVLGLGRTGSVSLTTRAVFDAPDDPEQTPHVLSHVPHPYDVFRFFHRVEFDVKTDIEYPNRLRPDVNPGYPTSYPPPPQP